MIDTSNRRWLLVLAGLITLAHLPLVAVQIQERWRYPHYQYVPLLLAAAAGLAWSRRELPVADLTPRPRAALGFLGASVLLLATGVFLYSPWLGTVAFLLGLAGLGLAWQGRGAVTRYGAVWALLWLALPLPMGWDQTLIESLQTWTSRISSNLLDLGDIPHLMAGNALEFAERQFLVEEACSGVQSLFALVAAVGAYLVWRQRPWSVAVLMLPAAVAAAVLMNVFRVTAIALAYHGARLDLSEGWRHEVLGFVAFVLALLSMTAFEQVLLFLVAPIRPIPNPKGGSMSARSPATLAVTQTLGTFWNRVVAGTQDALILMPPRLAGVGGVPTPADFEPAPPAEAPAPAAPLAGWSWGLILALFAGLALGQWSVWLLSARSQGSRAPLTVLPSAERLASESMPAQVGSWSRVKFGREHRSVSSNFGEHSAIWDYERDGVTSHFSCDYPFIGWHELTQCYRGIGWTIESREVVTATVRDGTPEPPFVVVTLSMPTGEHALLCFTMIDQAGEPLAINEGQPGRLSLVRSLKDRWRKWLNRQDARGESYQIQFFAPSTRPLTPQALQDLTRQFLDLRRSLVSVLQGSSTP